MENWYELIYYAPPEIRKIASIASELEDALNYVMRWCEMGKMPDVEMVYKVISYVQALAAESMAIVKQNSNREEWGKIEKDFKSFNTLVLTSLKNLERAIGTNDVHSIKSNLGPTHIFLYSFIHTILTEIKSRVQRRVLEEFAYSAKRRLGHVPVEEERRRRGEEVEAV